MALRRLFALRDFLLGAFLGRRAVVLGHGERFDFSRPALAKRAQILLVAAEGDHSDHDGEHDDQC